MIVLSKVSTAFPGVKEVYTLSRFTHDNSRERIDLTLDKFVYSADGFPKTSSISLYIENKGLKRKIVDPNWSEVSTPPKPLGFVLDDPETWGDLMWEDIPMVYDTSGNHFNLIKQISPVEGDTSYEAFVRSIFKQLQINGTLPGADAGWTIEKIADTTE